MMANVTSLASEASAPAVTNKRTDSSRSSSHAKCLHSSLHSSSSRTTSATFIHSSSPLRQQTRREFIFSINGIVIRRLVKYESESRTSSPNTAQSKCSQRKPGQIQYPGMGVRQGGFVEVPSWVKGQSSCTGLGEQSPLRS